VTFVLLQINYALSSEFPAQIMEAVHQVSIRVSPDVPFGSGHKCSGVLISNFTVLTSASCLLKDEETGEFYKAEELIVAMGRLNRSDPLSPSFSTDVTVVKPHSRFSRKTFANNLAILEVAKVEFGLTIIPVLDGISNHKVVSNLDCYVLGWRSSSGELTELLMQTNTKTTTCDGSRNLPLATFCTSEYSQITDTCVGEEGSGIFCNGELKGIVSRDCRGNNEQTVYTDVSQNFNWIALSHLNDTLKMIDSEILRKVLFSTLDIIAYFSRSSKLADDFEMVKFVF